MSTRVKFATVEGAATLFTPGTPDNGAETTPSGLTTLSVPLASVIRNLPLGRKAMLHGPLRRFVTVSTVNGGEGFAGFGAFVCPGNAGFAHPAWP